MNLLTDLIITLIGYLALGFSYLGFGWIATRILKIDFPAGGRWFVLVWLGWAVVLFLFQFLNLFIPIDALSSIPLLTLGVVFAIAFLNDSERRPVGRVFPWIYGLLLAITSVWIAVLSMSSPTIFDDGLYHFNTIRWLNEYPVVLGLGNLHSRLAFNQSFFTYVASLNLYPLYNHGYNLANGFLFLVLMAECLWHLAGRYVRRDPVEGPPSSGPLLIFFIPTLIYMALIFAVSRTGISSPSPDIASLFLQVLLFYHFVREFDENMSGKGGKARIVFILVLSATLITVKLSNLFYTVALCGTLLLMRINLRHPPSKHALLGAGRLMILPALILLVWGVRGILLSGCPVYPSTFGCLPVPWAEPIDSVRLEAERIFSWARENGVPPDQVLKSWSWLGPWADGIWRNNTVTVVYPVMVSILGLVSGLLLFKRNSHKNINPTLFWIPVPVLMGLIFWFILAPDPRFANALFWILPVAVLTVVLKILESSQKLKSWIILVMFVMINAGVVLFFVNNPQIFTSLPTDGYAPLPKVRLVEKKTLSGATIWTPLNGNQCWDSRIPCTPDYNENLNFIDNRIFPEFTTGGL